MSNGTTTVSNGALRRIKRKQDALMNQWHALEERAMSHRAAVADIEARVKAGYQERLARKGAAPKVDVSDL